MRALLIIPILLLGCTPTIDRVDRKGRETTDSALSILDSLPTTTTVYETRIKTLTQTKVVPRVEIQKELVYIEAERSEIGPLMAMSRPSTPTVVTDTVYIERVVENRILTASKEPKKKRWSLFNRVDTVYVRDTIYLSR